MQMTDRGLLALARHEGVVPGPYRDSTGAWTFGIGHTAAAGEPDPATMPRGMPADLDAAIREAFRLFRTDLAAYEEDVRRAVTAPLAPHEFDALVSFHYNTGGIARATLTRHINAGNRVAAADAFLNWRKPASIIPRRVAERDLFRDGRSHRHDPDLVGGSERPRRLLAAGSAAHRDASVGPAAPRQSPIQPKAADRLVYPAGCNPHPPVQKELIPMRYVRPTSLTWWAGLLAMLTGIASVALPATGPVGELSRLVALLAGSGDASPAGLIFLGLGLIGLRDRIERGFRGND